MRPRGRFVLYWMTAARRARRNFALDRAAELAAEAGRPLLVLEALRADYPHASERFHRFVADGMADNARAFAGTAARYAAFIEPRAGAGRGLLAALSAESCAVVADDHPGFLHPRMLAAAAERASGRLEAVDGCGILPLSAVPRAFPVARSFRAHLRRELPAHLAAVPAEDPLRRRDLPRLEGLPSALRIPGVAETPAAVERALAAAAPDRTVPAVALRGGQTAARGALRAFLRDGLPRYGEGRNHPDADASSGLSPWLHFGHISAHEVRAAVVRADAPGSEAFLDQLVTWRELGFAAAARDPGNHARYEGLPAWARATLEEHADDRREAAYTIEDLAASRTDDPVWNAAQRQLVQEGRMHNYLRMLWGKRVLSWTASPRAAFDTLVELNDRYALDGRDPNSYTGISWCLGKYDRAWGPERPVFGKVRYMSTASTLKKLRMKQYLRRYGPAS